MSRILRARERYNKRTGSTKINQSAIQEARAAAVRGIGIPVVKRYRMGRV